MHRGASPAHRHAVAAPLRPACGGSAPARSYSPRPRVIAHRRSSDLSVYAVRRRRRGEGAALGATGCRPYKRNGPPSICFLEDPLLLKARPVRRQRRRRRRQRQKTAAPVPGDLQRCCGLPALLLCNFCAHFAPPSRAHPRLTKNPAAHVGRVKIATPAASSATPSAKRHPTATPRLCRTATTLRTC